MQKSIPWGYLTGDDSLVGYTAKEDSTIRACMIRAGGVVVDSGIRTLAAFANLGVFYSVDNKLAVTNPGAAANRIDVNTGASFACGIFHYNSASIGAGGDITSPAANPRIDRVVVRANFGAASYVPANASAALFTVPTNTARVTVIHGAEAAGPVAPALTQDAARLTYWDIPLYQYQISVAGAITAITDEREWVDAETKKLVVIAVDAFNHTTTARVILAAAGGGLMGVWMIDGVIIDTWGHFHVPADFISGTAMLMYPIIRPATSGNYYGELRAYAATGGEPYSTHFSNLAAAAYAVTGGIPPDNNYIGPLTVAGIDVNDLVTLFVSRDSFNVLDTINNDVWCPGFLVTYLGWR